MARFRVRRWCERCGRFTASVSDVSWGGEICAEHDPELDEEDDEDYWPDIDVDEDGMNG